MTTPSTSKAKPAHVITRLSTEMRASLDDYAEKRHITPSEVIRALLSRLPQLPIEIVDRLTTETSIENSAQPAAVNHYFQPKTKKLDIRLSPAELTMLTTQANSLGTSRAGFIVASLRTTLLKKPQPLFAEIIELRAATRALNGIGTNLNQIARRLNEQPGPAAGLARTLAELLSAMTRQKAALTAILKATEERWA